MSLTPVKHSKELWKRRLFLPAYGVAEAARYAQIKPRTVARWHSSAVLSAKDKGKPLSYLQLVEVAFVATFRELGVSLQKIRKAREYLAQKFDSEFPFAEIRLMTEGHHVLLDLQSVEPDAELGYLILADQDGQEAWQSLISERFTQFDYEAGLAIRWYPQGKGQPVVIDPRIYFGAPTVRGIPTWAIKGRYDAGESVDDIAMDFDLGKEQVQRALSFEGISLAA